MMRKLSSCFSMTQRGRRNAARACHVPELYQQSAEENLCRVRPLQHMSGTQKSVHWVEPWNVSDFQALHPVSKVRAFLFYSYQSKEQTL